MVRHAAPSRFRPTNPAPPYMSRVPCREPSSSRAARLKLSRASGSRTARSRKAIACSMLTIWMRGTGALNPGKNCYGRLYFSGSCSHSFRTFVSHVSYQHHCFPTATTPKPFFGFFASRRFHSWVWLCIVKPFQPSLLIISIIWLGRYFLFSTCSIPDDQITPRRSGLFMARSILRECGGSCREGGGNLKVA